MNMALYKGRGKQELEKIEGIKIKANWDPYLLRISQRTNFYLYFCHISVTYLCENLDTFLGGWLLEFGDGALPPPLFQVMNLRGPGETTSPGTSGPLNLETSPSWHAGARTLEAQPNPMKPKNQLKECCLSDW